MSETLAAGPVAPETVRLYFRRPPFWSGVMSWGVGGSWFGLYLLYGVRAATADLAVLVVGVALALLPVALLVWRALARPKDVPPIELGPGQITLPLSVESNRVIVSRYVELRSLSVRQRGQRQFLVVETGDGAFVYPTASFVDARALEVFFAAIRERLTSIPGGAEIVRSMAQRDERMRAAIDARPTVTYALMGAIAVGFLMQILGMRHLDDILGRVRFGANVPALVQQGEWWRLITANFLHGGFAHIFINGVSLFSLGALLERVLGPWRLLLVYLLSGVGGAAASAFLGSAMGSVGASTAVFGLFGALVAVNAHYRRDLPIIFRQPWSVLLFFLGLNVVLPIALPMIDWLAHVGGFTTGLIVTWPLLGPRTFVFDRPTTTPIKALTVSLVLLHAGALAFGAREAMDTSEGATQRRFGALIDASTPDYLNLHAWLVAIDERASSSDFDVALAFVERGLALKPGDWQMLDTLATLLYRQGRFDEALEQSSAALREQLRDPDPRMRDLPEIATQLARFAEARARKQGVRTDGGIASDAVRLRLVTEPRRQVVVETTGVVAPRGLTVYATAQHTGSRIALVRVRLGSARVAEAERAFDEVSAEPVLRSGSELRLLWIDARECGCAEDAVELKVWQSDPTVDLYP